MAKKISTDALRCLQQESPVAEAVSVQVKVAQAESNSDATDNDATVESAEDAVIVAITPARRKPAFKRKENHEIANFAEMKKRMATMKSLAPIISAAAFVSSSPDKAAEVTSTMIKDASKLSSALCEMAGIDPLGDDTRWLVSQSMEIAAWQISAQAKREHSIGISDKGFETMMASARVIADGPLLEGPRYPNNNMSLSIRLKLSAMKSVMGIARELASAECVLSGNDMIPGFAFDKKEITHHAGQVMFNAVADVVSATDLKVGDEETKLTLFQGMLNHASTLYTASLTFAVDRVIEDVELAPATKKMGFSEINLQEVDERFHGLFSALVAIGIDSELDYVQAFSGSAQQKSAPQTRGKKRMNGIDF